MTSTTRRSGCTLLSAISSAILTTSGCQGKVDVGNDPTPVHPCAGVACAGHGTCAVTSADLPICACDPNYHAQGLDCVADADPCDGIDCSAHGTCVVDGELAACNCDADYHADGLACIADPVANAPVVTLVANPTTVDGGGTTTLTWSATNATSCTASGAWTGSRATSGSEESAAITATSTFTLACEGPGGTAQRTAMAYLGGVGTVYVEKYFETENPSQDLQLNDVGELTYVEGGGFAGSNCWQLRLFGDTWNENNVGWVATHAGIPESATATMFVGHLLYITSGLVEEMATTVLGGKMLDVRMHEHAGDPETRQVVIWRWYDVPDQDGLVDTGVTGVVPTLLNGGAGGWFVRQLGPTQFDLRDYVDEWVWFLYEFNAIEQYTALWIKTQDGVFTAAPDAPVMKREANDPQDWQHRWGWNETPYAYTAHGWSGAYNVWGFWDDLAGRTLTAEDWVRLDNLIVSDSWIAPPF